MKHCCPGVVWVTLSALWLVASNSQPPGCQDCAEPQAQQVLAQLPVRPWRHSSRPSCPAGMNWIAEAGRCCTLCPAGMFLQRACSSRSNKSICSPCSTGTFLSQPNTFRKCQACYECDRQAFQSVLSNCSATSNIVCGCKPGHFRSCLDQSCSDFSCRQCQPCTGRLIQQPCSEAQDTLCGSCKPDFYAEGGECRPCHGSVPETCGKECQRVCGGAGSKDSGLEYILLALTGPLFLGALVIYHKRKQLRHHVLAGSPCPVVQLPTPPAVPMAAAAPTMPWHPDSPRGLTSLCWQSPEHQSLLQKQPMGTAPPGTEPEPPEPRGALLQGSQLYAIIDVVPVRRWKEFMRVLELREAEIELVELEVTHIRDQQYEMLKRWCQQTSATLDRVFAALEHMELAGCAEALRRSLPAGP